MQEKTRSGGPQGYPETPAPITEITLSLSNPDERLLNTVRSDPGDGRRARRYHLENRPCGASL